MTNQFFSNNNTVKGTNADGEKAFRVIPSGGTDLNPLAKFVEAIYTNSDQTVTYNYYESASKVTLYNAVITNYSEAQDTTFVSAAWT